MKAVRRPPVAVSPVNASAPLAQEHEFEAARGLPEALPPGERLLWQGSPQWQALAREAFHLRKLVVYFAVLVVLRLVLLASDQASLGTMVVSALWMLLLAGSALGMLAFIAWLSARSAIYTVTNRRVVMRIGVVLTLTFNIPFKRIAAAGLHLKAEGHGDLPLQLAGDDRIAYLHLWPHARPWRVGQPEPMLRCVPEAAAVARTLAQAWAAETGVQLPATSPAATASTATTEPTPAGPAPVMATGR